MARERTFSVPVWVAMLAVFAAAFFMFVTPAKAAGPWVVDTATSTATCADPDYTCTSLQDALAAADEGDTITLLGGTYDLGGDLELTFPITITGTTQADTIIDVSDSAGPGILITGNNITLSNLTVLGPAVGSADSHGILLQPADGATEPLLNATLDSVTVQGSAGSEIFIQFVQDALLSNVSANGNSTDGAGITILTSQDSTLSGITTMGNNGGGIALLAPELPYAFPSAATTTSINTTDINSSEQNQLYIDETNGDGVGALDITPEFAYVVRNATHQVDGDLFTYYQQDEDGALALANALQTDPYTNNTDSTIQTILEDGGPKGEYLVGEGLSIQAAVDSATSTDVIYVKSGTYDEAVSIVKSITLYGEGSGITTLAPASGVAVTLPGALMPSGQDTIDAVTVVGFTLAPADGSVAFLAEAGTPDDGYYVTNLTLQDIVVADNDRGIELQSVDGALLDDITLEDIGGGVGALELAGVSDVVVQNSSFARNDIAVRLLPTDTGVAAGFGANGPITITNSIFGDNGANIDNQDLSATITTTGNQLGATHAGTTEVVSTPEGSITMQIPAGTVIATQDGWDGIVQVPTVVVTPVEPEDEEGFSTEVILSIEVGSVNTQLVFDQGVRLVFEGQAGNLVGWSQGDTFTPIAEVCEADTQEVGNDLPAGGDCYRDSGDDLIVWTKHFTVFTVYSQTALSNDAEEDAGGGGTVIRPVLPTGEVLGAATTTQVLGAEVDPGLFSVNLRQGMRGDDVVALQQRLIDEGFLKIAAPTGYFGPLTLAAVKAFQAHYGVPATGFVGPMTRAVLNS